MSKKQPSEAKTAEPRDKQIKSLKEVLHLQKQRNDKTKLCPRCNSELIQDYWDTVEENEQGDFVLDAFEAWVCKNRCGYYKKIARRW